MWYMAKAAKIEQSLNEQATVRHDGKRQIYGYHVHIPDDTKEKGHRYAFHNFGSEFAAKHFLDFMINGRKYKIRKAGTIEFEDGSTIRAEFADHLDDILEYEYKNVEEREWQMPEPSITMHHALRDGPSRVRRAVSGDVAPEPPKPNTERKKAKREAEKSSKPVKTQSGETFGPAEIAHWLDRDPSHVRAALRKAMEKPDGGWSWPMAKKEDICKIVQKGLKPL